MRIHHHFQYLENFYSSEDMEILQRLEMVTIAQTTCYLAHLSLSEVGGIIFLFNLSRNVASSRG